MMQLETSEHRSLLTECAMQEKGKTWDGHQEYGLIGSNHKALGNKFLLMEVVIQEFPKEKGLELRLEGQVGGDHI